jgi:hypothetical protein
LGVAALRREQCHGRWAQGIMAPGLNALLVMSEMFRKPLKWQGWPRLPTNILESSILMMCLSMVSPLVFSSIQRSTQKSKKSVQCEQWHCCEVVSSEWIDIKSVSCYGQWTVKYQQLLPHSRILFNLWGEQPFDKGLYRSTLKSF